ncbi:MAG: DUF3549 family protein [Gammaproteobacteria bacterium]|nr:DUF3549 family protein [Gammaproteobacteria bacterium]
MSQATSNNPVPTLAALMDTAEAQWRLFDLGRKIQPISKNEFALIEQNQKPYPYPIQQKARFALVFWQQANSQQSMENPFIWFLQFDVDEMGLLKLQQRDHYISLVIKALGEEFISKGDEKSSELDNHPYSFTPDQNRQAAFNAQVKVALKQPASLHYEHVQAYFAGQIDIDKWQELSIQGIADFCARLTDGNNEQGLINLLPDLSVQTLSVLGANLEHQDISLPLTQALIDLQDQKLAEQDNEEVLYLLRSLAGSVAKPLIKKQLTKLLNSEEALDQTLFIIIAGRLWSYLEDKELLHLFFEKLAANHDQELFNGLFADLVSVPTTRNLVLGMLRDPSRPDHVSRALGAIFAQA